MKKQSLGVVIPSFNSIRWLPGHLESMRPWLDLADEVVVVDSHSTDGSREMFERDLLPAHPNVRILQHPRGLYQSWNFGIRSLGTEYFYMSTVGDPISREGLAHMLGLAQRFSADAVISKPRFISESGAPMGTMNWPIDDILGTLGAASPVCLSGVGLYLFALINCTAAILGSSASNLCRTACFQARPFPADFGTSGDGAWTNIHALEVKMVVTPEQFSSFREHPKSYSKKDYAVSDLPLKFFAAAKAAAERALLQEGAIKQDLLSVDIARIIDAVEAWLQKQRALEIERQRRLPWSLTRLPLLGRKTGYFRVASSYNCLICKGGTG